MLQCINIYVCKYRNKISREKKSKNILLLLNCRRVTKMDKTTGSKVSFMAIHPELGRLDSLDIYDDDQIDGTCLFIYMIFCCLTLSVLINI